MQAHDFRDVVFKGCTRPALMFGVPLIPLFIVCVAVALLAQLTTILALALIVPIVLVMGHVTRTDDQQYRLLWLRLYCRVIQRNQNGRFWKASTYAPVNHRKTR